MKRLLYVLPLVAFILLAGCGGGVKNHDCINAVRTMQKYATYYGGQIQDQARGAMDSYCWVEDCIAMMNMYLTEQDLIDLVDDIHDHCPCLQELDSSVPFEDYSKMRDWCEGYKDRQYAWPEAQA